MPKKVNIEKMIADAIEYHGDHYSFENFTYSGNKKFCTITCKYHGDFQIRAGQFFNPSSLTGCRKCGIIKNSKSKKLDREEVFDRIYKKFNNAFNIDTESYTLVNSPLTCICPKHGEFVTSANRLLNPKMKYGCNYCATEHGSKKLKLSDSVLEERLLGKYPSFKFDMSTYTAVNKNIKYVCPDHGIMFSTPKNLLRDDVKHGCIKCSHDSNAEKLLLTADQINERLINRFNGKIKFLKFPKNDDGMHTFECLHHGKFENLLFNVLQPNNVHGCRKCSRMGNSKFEEGIKLYLSQISHSIQRGNRKVIKPQELDFVLNNEIAIECNGNYWHSELQGKAKNYHLNKTEKCNESNIRLIHIREDEWEHKSDIVKSRLSNILHSDNIKKYHARKLIVKIVSKKNEMQFLVDNHIQGKCPSSLAIGLYDGVELLSIMTFGKSRFNKNYEYELIRFCSKNFTLVRGAASRLFSYFIKNYDPKSIVSYSDRAWNTGKLYESLGFEFSHNSTPNYKYFHRSSVLHLMSRQKFQKHKLSNILEHYDSNKTEWENMQDNNYDRIWDCGNSVYVWMK